MLSRPAPSAPQDLAWHLGLYLLLLTLLRSPGQEPPSGSTDMSSEQTEKASLAGMSRRGLHPSESLALDFFTRKRCRRFLRAVSASLGRRSEAVPRPESQRHSLPVPASRHHRRHCGRCSVTKSRPTLCARVDCSTPGFRVPHFLPSSQ